MKILVVDDEKLLVKGIKFNLENDGYEVVTGCDGMEAVELAASETPDLIVLDLMMPRLDGLEACTKIREFSQVPIIMLTAKSEDMDKLLGFEHGADDYLTKPFDPEELCARLRALTRRTGEVVLDSVSYGDLELGLADLELKCADKAVRLSQREGAVMELLMRSPQNVFSKQALLTRVWGTEGETGVNNVEAYISFLRKKLAFLKSNVSIDTIRMLGYRLSCPEDCKA